MFSVFHPMSLQSCTSAPRRGKYREDNSVVSFLFFPVFDVSVDDCPVFVTSVQYEVLKNVCFCKSGIS